VRRLFDLASTFRGLTARSSVCPTAVCPSNSREGGRSGCLCSSVPSHWVCINVRFRIPCGTVVRSNLCRPRCSDNCWVWVVHQGSDRSPDCGTARETRADDLGHPCTRPRTSTGIVLRSLGEGVRRIVVFALPDGEPHNSLRHPLTRGPYGTQMVPDQRHCGCSRSRPLSGKLTSHAAL
jgi:hypothetical protein